MLRNNKRKTFSILETIKMILLFICKKQSELREIVSESERLGDEEGLGDDEMRLGGSERGEGMIVTKEGGYKRLLTDSVVQYPSRFQHSLSVVVNRPLYPPCSKFPLISQFSFLVFYLFIYTASPTSFPILLSTVCGNQYEGTSYFQLKRATNFRNVN